MFNYSYVSDFQQQWPSLIYMYRNVQHFVMSYIIYTVPCTRYSLESGDTLVKGEMLCTEDGRYQARLQFDGNFVVSGPDGIKVTSTDVLFYKENISVLHVCLNNVQLEYTV